MVTQSHKMASKLPSNLQKALTLCAFQLETSAFPLSSPDLALQYAKLLRLIALSALPSTPTASAEPAIAAVTTAADRLRAAGPTHAVLPAIAAAACAALRSAGGRAAAAAALDALIVRVGDARTALVDNVVSVIAGGPERRCVMVLGAREGGAVEEAVREAAVDMERLDVVVVAGGAGAAAADSMTARLRDGDGVGDVRVVRVEDVLECLRDLRVHGLVLDAVAVSGDGIVGDCSAGVVAAVARTSGVRVFACAVDHDVLPVGEEGVACVKALRESRGHPGRVVPYESVVRSGARLRIVNPLWDFVNAPYFDVLVTSSGALAAGGLGELEGLVRKDMATGEVSPGDSATCTPLVG